MKHVVTLAILLPSIMIGQDIAGDWQGTVRVGKIEARLVVTIAKSATGGWTASEVTPDDGSNPILSNSVSFDGSTLKIAFNAVRASYRGRLEREQEVIQGNVDPGLANSA